MLSILVVYFQTSSALPTKTFVFSLETVPIGFGENRFRFRHILQIVYTFFLTPEKKYKPFLYPIPPCVTGYNFGHLSVSELNLILSSFGLNFTHVG